MAKQKKPPDIFGGPKFGQPVYKPTPKPKPKAKPTPKRGPYKIYKPTPRQQTQAIPTSGPTVTVRSHTRKKPETRNLRNMSEKDWNRLTPRQKMNVRASNGQRIGFIGASSIEAHLQKLRALHQPGVPSARMATTPAVHLTKEQAAAERRQGIEMGLAGSGIMGDINRSASLAPVIGNKWVGSQFGQLGGSFAGFPMGLYEAGKAQYGDIFNLVYHQDPSFSASRTFLKNLAMGPIDDIQHPIDRMASLVMDAWAIASLGAGSVNKFGGFKRGVGEARAAGVEGLGPTVKAGIKEARKPAVGRLDPKGVNLPVPLSTNPLRRAAQRAILKKHNAQIEAQRAGTRTPTRKAIVKEATGESRVGRVLRSVARIDADLNAALAARGVQAARWASHRSADGLWRTYPMREDALFIRGAFGHEAYTNPADVIAEVRATGEEMLGALRRDAKDLSGDELKKNQRQVKKWKQTLKDLPEIEKLLKDETFRGHADALDALAHVTQQVKIARAWLTEERAGAHLADVRSFFRGGRYKAPTIAERIAGGERADRFVGTQVRMHDRDNLGRIANIDTAENVAYVKFHNRRTGAKGEGYFPLDQMHVSGDKSGKFHVTLPAEPGPLAEMSAVHQPEVRAKWENATDAEIQARIDAIQGEWDKLITKVQETGASPVETAYTQSDLNKLAGRRRRQGLPKRDTLANMERDAAEQVALEIVDRRPDLSYIRDALSEMDELKNILTDRQEMRNFGIPERSVPARSAAAEGMRKPIYPEGTVFHGSPEGLLKPENVDPYRHTRAWQEGIGFYVTESAEKAGTYAVGRTATGTRRAAAAENGAVTPLKLDPKAKVLDMDAPADMDLWRDVAKSAHIDTEADFQKYVLDHIHEEKPTNQQVRDEVMYDLHDTLGAESQYAIEESITAHGYQATTHTEGHPPHRVWVIKDPSIIESVDPATIKYEDIPASPSDALVENLAKQRELAKRREAGGSFTAEEAHALMAEREQILNALHGPEGAFPVSTMSQYYKLPRRGISGRRGNYGKGDYGVPAPGTPVGMRERFTGVNLKGGLPVTSHAVIDQYLATTKLAGIHDTWEALWEAATPERRSADDIPVRSVRGAPEEMKAQMAETAQEIVEHPDDPSILPRMLDRMRGLVVGTDKTTWVKEARKEVDVGKADPEGRWRWIDPNYVKDMAPTVTKGGIWDAWDLLNNVGRVGTTYVRPAYLLNAPGNVVMGLIDQGVMAPANMWRGMNAKSIYGEELTSLIDKGSGTGLSHSYAGTTGIGAGLTQKLARFWSVVVDDWYRRSAFIHQAEKAGYYGKEGMQRLFERDHNGDFIHRDDIQVISDTARNSAVHFENLTPKEREQAQRLIFFYPWVSRGSWWTIDRLLLEHPAKAAAILNIGKLGEEDRKRILGALSQWAELSGIFPVGDVEKGRALTISPSSVWTPLTTVQTAAAAQDLVGSLLNLRQPTGEALRSLTPATSLITSLVPGFGNKATGIPGALEQTAIPILLSRLGVDLPGVPKSSKTFPETGAAAGWYPYLGGGMIPRETVVEHLHPKTKKDPVKERNVKLAHWEKMLGRKLPDLVRQASATKLTYDRLRDKKEKELGVKKLTDAQKGLLKLAMLRHDRYGRKVPPDWIELYASDFKSGDPIRIRKANSTVERLLYWDVYDRFSAKVHALDLRAASRKARARAKAG